MTNAAATRSLKPVSLADRLDELAGRFGLALAGTLPLSQLPDVREAIQDLRTEAENRGMVGRSCALGRIGLLTEVWECLATDPENRADEVGFFCAQALTQLARSDEPGDDGDDGIVDWILDHSTSTWGEYLALLEGQEGEDEDRGAGLEALDPSLEPDADASLRIDAQALIRLFQAGAAGDRTGTSGSSPPAVSAPVRPAVQVRPDTVPPVFTMPARPAAQVQPDKIVPAFTIPALPQKIDLDEEIREAFLADASDLFERIEPLVLGLGRDADPRQSLRELGRCFHTLKGAAGSVGLADLATLVHALEEHLEETSSPASADLIDVLYQTLGYLDGLIGLLRTRSAGTGGSRSIHRGFRSIRGRSISTTVLEHRPPGFHPRAGAGHRAGPGRLVLPGILIRGRDRWLGVRARWADPRAGVPLRRADGPGIRADRQAPPLDRSGRVAEDDF